MTDREKVIKALEDFNKNRICLPHLIPWDEITDAIALLKEQEHKDKMYHALEEDWKRIQELLKEQPEIVRCKDCKHFTEPDENGFGVCMRIMHGCQSWGFCADGERSVKWE